MLDIQDYRRSLERSRASLARLSSPTTFELKGLEWDLLPGVFAPDRSPTTGLCLDLLEFDGGSFLEMGCGAGVVAVSAALAGCDRVVASDISEDAVRNAAINAERHGVADRVRAVHGDLFGGLDEGERFDIVFWSTPFVLAPDDYEFETVHERGYVDPGYVAHNRFLAEARDWLAPAGKVLLHFSNRGDVLRLLRLAGEHGQGLRLVRSILVQEGEHSVEHMLIEITA